MTGRTHDLAAITALGIVVLLHPVGTVTLATGATAVIANLVGGIAPDIDQPTAPFWRNLPIGGFFGKFFDRLLGGHRFLSHSIIGVVLFGFGFYYFLQFLHPSIPNIAIPLVWWAFMIGFVSHLFMDMLTREGVPLLLPVPVKVGIPPIKALRPPTGGFVENLIIFPGLILLNGYIIYMHYGNILTFFHHQLK